MADVSLGLIRDYLKGLYDIANMELYGSDISERPDAAAVKKGTTFTLLNKDFDSWVSSGTGWEEV